MEENKRGKKVRLSLQQKSDLALGPWQDGQADFCKFKGQRACGKRMRPQRKGRKKGLIGTGWSRRFLGRQNKVHRWLVLGKQVDTKVNMTEMEQGLNVASNLIGGR